MGYNGGARGVFNDCLSDEPGKCGHLHAEINALVKMNFNEAAAKKMYTTTVPCFNCAVAIVNANIGEVIYLEEYRLTDGLELLKSAGVLVKKHGQS
jgi:dCMP deaminase